MKSAGITDIIINTHTHSDRVRALLGDGEKLGIRITYCHEERLRGIGAALKHAQALLGGETFVVMNGDVVADIDLSHVLAYHHEQQADVTLVLRTEKGLRAHGPLDFDADVSLSTLIGEAPDEAGFLQSAGIRVMSPRIFDFLRPGEDCSLGRTLAKMVEVGCHIEGYLSDGYWADLRSWEKYGHILWEIGRGFVPEAPVT